jgi:hypothetical protein
VHQDRTRVSQVTRPSDVGSSNKATVLPLLCWLPPSPSLPPPPTPLQTLVSMRRLAVRQKLKDVSVQRCLASCLLPLLTITP